MAGFSGITFCSPRPCDLSQGRGELWTAGHSPAFAGPEGTHRHNRTGIGIGPGGRDTGELTAGGKGRNLSAMPRKKPTPAPASDGHTLFRRPLPHRVRHLILPRLLTEETRKLYFLEEQIGRAHEILLRWADQAKAGKLDKKETSLNAEFLHEVFGDALGYIPSTKQPDAYGLEREFPLPGGGQADGALGDFATGRPANPVAVIELKGLHTDLDRDKFNGRTAVQQCWDYLNALPDCPWGIVSNFGVFRLYHRNRTPQAFEQFTLEELRDRKRFGEFFCLFERGGLIKAFLGQPPRALQLLERSETQQIEVGDKLYNYYSDNRLRLIQHLAHKLHKPLDEAIAIAQKLVDRIIFVAFCEDRNLLPPKTIARTFTNVPPFAKVTNPRWRNFLDLFRAVDTGHPELKLDHGFNGGLFKKDDAVDELQLDDEPWTNFFATIGTYDFRDEINVDVLGHLFEKSVTELERLRGGGLFEVTDLAEPGLPTMPKSAQRKRFGIYYTPPAFTRFLVDHTLGDLVNQRFADLAKSHGVDPEAAPDPATSPKVAAYWRDCLAALRGMTVCDPACGSGAFLIQAYDRFEDEYRTVADHLAQHDGPAAEKLFEDIPDFILRENLHGSDLSPQAVEITQLALWIRSARPGHTLANLSGNIVCRNSLVDDPAVAGPHAMEWAQVFPAIFARKPDDGGPGFDCVIGNPPWERMKLQEREFFALSAPEIAGAVSAATRRQLIAKLEAKNPELYQRYIAAQEAAEKTLNHVRTCGRFPLTAKGDVNTYMVFAELAQRIVAPAGRVGLLLPSGIATDDTTKEFFATLMNFQSLVLLFDFENKKGIFPDVHRSFKFCTLVFGGAEVKNPSADFVFFAHSMDDLEPKERQIKLSAKDLKLLNPNTRTCPIFRTRRDAELTKAIYRRVPVLIDHSRKQGGNPWGVRFVRMFDQTNDAELFHDAKSFEAEGFRLEGNRWLGRKEKYLPLYEAKMIQAYDHRAAGIRVEGGNWVRQGQTEETSLVMHQNPEFAAMPRFWVHEDKSRTVNGGRIAVLAYKDVTSSTNQRTMIAAMVPAVGFMNSAPLMLPGKDISVRVLCCLLANLNSFAYDFVARQKVGGLHLNFFIVEQLPTIPPDRYADRCPWKKTVTLERWISDRVLELSCTADDMKPLAEAAGFDPPVVKWKEKERADLLADLDAAYFHLYGIERADVEYILSTFSGTRDAESHAPGLGLANTRDLILAAFDQLASRG